MKICLILAFALLVTGSSHLRAQDPATREFTSSSGRKIKATLVSVDGDKVTIKRADGKDFTTFANSFSEEDQAYFKGWKPAGTAAGASGDWFQWRGPNRDGSSSESGLNRDWEKKKPELVWRAKGLGGGMSSLSIWQGKIFTMGEKDGGTVMLCLNLEDGEKVWETKVPGQGGPNGTPTVDPATGIVYGVSKDGELSALKVDDGSVLWTVSYANDLGGKMMSGWGFSESPLVDGDRLICTPGGEKALLAALDKSTGKVIWKTDTGGADLGDAGQDGAGYSSIVVSNGGGVKQYVQLVGRGLVGVDAESGRLLWNYNRIANGTANIPTPIVRDDYVFGSTGYNDGGTALLKLSKKGDGVAAKEEYYHEGKDLQNHHGGMILIGDHVFLGHGHNNGFPQCVELKSGKILWDKERGAGAESAAIAYADGLLFFRYQNHVMALIEADPKGYQPKGSFKIDSSNGESWPQPVIQGGKLYLRDQDELLCYDVSA